MTSDLWELRVANNNMSKIAIISCCKKKLETNDYVCAEELYISPLFKTSLQHAQKHADRVYIVSAKHGLLKLSDKIQTYYCTLRSFSAKDRRQWGKMVMDAMIKEGIGQPQDEILIYAGKCYLQPLCDAGLSNYTAMFKGMRGIGQIIKNLKQEESNHN